MGCVISSPKKSNDNAITLNTHNNAITLKPKLNKSISEMNQCLLNAIRMGRYNDVQNLILDYQSLDKLNILNNLKDEHGNTPFLLATINGNVDIVVLLSFYEIGKISDTNADGDNSLKLAVRYNHINIVKEFIETDYGISNKDIYNALKLTEHKDIRNYLETYMKQHKIPIFEPISLDFNARDLDGKTALIRAVQFCIQNLDEKIYELTYSTLINLLNDERIDPNLYDNTGMTALMYACGHPENSKEQERLITSILENKRIDINFCVKKKSALKIAMENQCFIAIDLLVKDTRTSIDNITNSRGETVLIFAASHGRKDTVELILNRQSQCNAKPALGIPV